VVKNELNINLASVTTQTSTE